MTLTDTKQTLLTRRVQTGQTSETQSFDQRPHNQHEQLTTQTGSTHAPSKAAAACRVSSQRMQLSSQEIRDDTDRTSSEVLLIRIKNLRPGIRLNPTDGCSCESQLSGTKLNGSQLTLMTPGSDMLFKATLMLSRERTRRWNRMQRLNVCFHVLWAVYSFSISLKHHQSCC